MRKRSPGMNTRSYTTGSPPRRTRPARSEGRHARPAAELTRRAAWSGTADTVSRARSMVDAELELEHLVQRRDARGRPWPPPRRARRQQRAPGSSWAARRRGAAAPARARGRRGGTERAGHAAVGAPEPAPSNRVATFSPCAQSRRPSGGAAGCRSRRSGAATKVPSPCRRSMRPSRSSISRAWRRVIRVTPNRRARRRWVSRRSPARAARAGCARAARRRSGDTAVYARSRPTPLSVF